MLERQKMLNFLAEMQSKVTTNCDNSSGTEYKTWGFGWVVVVVVVSVEAKLSFVEPGRRWAHSPSSSGAPGVSYQGTMKTSVRMLRT